MIRRLWRALWCNIAHAGNVRTEWVTEDKEQWKETTLVEVRCGTCDRKLRDTARASCSGCGRRMRYHRPPHWEHH